MQAGQRHHKVVDGDVGHLGEFMLQTFAVWAVGVGENGYLEFAVTAYLFNRHVERQAVVFDRAQLCRALVGQAFAVFNVDEVTDNHIVAFGIGIDDGFAAQDDFIQVVERGRVDGQHFNLLFGVGFF